MWRPETWRKSSVTLVACWAAICSWELTVTGAVVRLRGGGATVAVTTTGSSSRACSEGVLPWPRLSVAHPRMNASPSCPYQAQTRCLLASCASFSCTTLGLERVHCISPPLYAVAPDHRLERRCDAKKTSVCSAYYT